MSIRDEGAVVEGLAMRAIVVDDEPLARDELAFLLGECGTIEVVGEAEDAESALSLCAAESVDVAFVDLRMPGPDGIALAAALRARHPYVQVVVVSAHDEGAARAYDAEIADYLLKPVRLERLRSTVGRLRALLGERDEPIGASPAELAAESMPETLSRIAVRRRDGYVVVDVQDVVYFEVRDELVWAVTREDRHSVDRTLSALAEVLPDTFFRSHRANLVRLDAIRRIEPTGQGKYDLILDHPDEPRIPLARERVKLLRERIPFTG